MYFNLPNILSLLRIAIAPVFFGMLLSEDSFLMSIGCILYFTGAATDYIDGWTARRYGKESTLGKFIDPLADKILTTAAFLVMVILHLIPLWMVIIIIIRDFGTTLLRAGAEAKDMHIKTLESARTKTFIQMTFQFAVFALIFFENVTGEKYSEVLYFPLFGIKSASLVMLFLTILTLWTFVEYLIKNRHAVSVIVFNAKKE